MVTVKTPVGTIGVGKEQPWLCLIWEVNGMEPGTFGQPMSITCAGPGRCVEDYEDAEVLQGPDEVWVRSKTERGERLIRRAAALLKLEVEE